MRISDWSSDVCSSDLPVIANYLEYGVRLESGRFARRIEMRGQHFGQCLIPWRAIRIFHQAGKIVSRFRSGHSDGPFHAEAAHFSIDGRSADAELSCCFCRRDARFDQFDRSEGHTSELQSLMRI